MTFKIEEFDGDDLEGLTQFVERKGKDNVINVQVYGLNLNYLVFYWEE